MQQQEEQRLRYTTGIPTLRSSSHRVRYSVEKASKNKNAPKPQSSQKNKTRKNEESTTMLPLSIRKVHHVPYDTTKYNLKKCIINLLKSLDPEIVGHFSTLDDDNDDEMLEYLNVPVQSLTRKSQIKKNSLSLSDEKKENEKTLSSDNNNDNNCCEKAQEYLSHAVATNEEFIQVFDAFVTEAIIPKLKARMMKEKVTPFDNDGNSQQTTQKKVTMYYQRPPTLRIQPGPARAYVKAHKDADYGHQPGELNFWIPLTDRGITGVDLYCESEEDKGDFAPLESDVGFATSFHGSHCKHYVNSNSTDKTRVSLDFRVGIEPFYDPHWQMIGTKDDHSRREVSI